MRKRKFQCSVFRARKEWIGRLCSIYGQTIFSNPALLTLLLDCLTSGASTHSWSNVKKRTYLSSLIVARCPFGRGRHYTKNGIQKLKQVVKPQPSSCPWATGTTQLEGPQTEPRTASLFSLAPTIPECRATQSCARRRLERRNKWKVDMKVEAQDTSVGSQTLLLSHGFMSRLWELIVDHHTASTENFTGALRTWETTGPAIVRHLLIFFSNFVSTTGWRKNPYLVLPLTPACLTQKYCLRLTWPTLSAPIGSRKRTFSLKKISNCIESCTIKWQMTNWYIQI